jgi:hypothetical protein
MRLIRFYWPNEFKLRVCGVPIFVDQRQMWIVGHYNAMRSSACNGSHDNAGIGGPRSSYLPDETQEVERAHVGYYVPARQVWPRRGHQGWKRESPQSGRGIRLAQELADL